MFAKRGAYSSRFKWETSGGLGLTANNQSNIWFNKNTIVQWPNTHQLMTGKRFQMHQHRNHHACGGQCGSWIGLRGIQVAYIGSINMWRSKPHCQSRSDFLTLGSPRMPIGSWKIYEQDWLKQSSLLAPSIVVKMENCRITFFCYYCKVLWVHNMNLPSNKLLSCPKAVVGNFIFGVIGKKFNNN